MTEKEYHMSVVAEQMSPVGYFEKKQVLNTIITQDSQFFTQNLAAGKWCLIQHFDNYSDSTSAVIVYLIKVKEEVFSLL